jgi:hypothetical protein
MSPLFNCRVLALSPEVVKRPEVGTMKNYTSAPLTECMYFSKECKQAIEDKSTELSIEVLVAATCT